MSFKERLERDISKVFLDTRFFAEERTIRYDGEEYRNVPTSLQKTGEDERQPKADDHAQGFHLEQAVLFCARSDLAEAMPEQGAWLEINSPEAPDFFERYKIISSFCEMGMLKVGLAVAGQ
ncbi:MAG: hypothetical protein HFE91_05960 [Acutalibacter sp.]|jgi:hypothetical protein|uniref:hypothetical protein n=1 Tax=Acutalibacter sp. TaxID=1918636 RepID=UPI002172D232|nr:hypothetical protein [Acutalibacter sp.]MCI9224993.1 hypothetical protein [Acutalibacter sp.]